VGQTRSLTGEKFGVDGGGGHPVQDDNGHLRHLSELVAQDGLESRQQSVSCHSSPYVLTLPKVPRLRVELRQ
jgi:hypothetical protein